MEELKNKINYLFSKLFSNKKDGKYVHPFFTDILRVIKYKKNIFTVLSKYKFPYNKEDMENIKVVEATTEAGFKKNSFIYEFMSSMRQKINDPLGVRAKKRKEISQR